MARTCKFETNKDFKDAYYKTPSADAVFDRSEIEMRVDKSAIHPRQTVESLLSTRENLDQSYSAFQGSKVTGHDFVDKVIDKVLIKMSDFEEKKLPYDRDAAVKKEMHDRKLYDFKQKLTILERETNRLNTNIKGKELALSKLDKDTNKKNFDRLTKEVDKLKSEYNKIVKSRDLMQERVDHVLKASYGAANQFGLRPYTARFLDFMRQIIETPNTSQSKALRSMFDIATGVQRKWSTFANQTIKTHVPEGSALYKMMMDISSDRKPLSFASKQTRQNMATLRLMLYVRNDPSFQTKEFDENNPIDRFSPLNGLRLDSEIIQKFIAHEELPKSEIEDLLLGDSVVVRQEAEEAYTQLRRLFDSLYPQYKQLSLKHDITTMSDVKRNYWVETRDERFLLFEKDQNGKAVWVRDYKTKAEAEVAMAQRKLSVPVGNNKHTFSVMDRFSEDERGSMEHGSFASAMQYQGVPGARIGNPILRVFGQTGYLTKMTSALQKSETQERFADYVSDLLKANDGKLSQDELRNIKQYSNYLLKDDYSSMNHFVDSIRSAMFLKYVVGNFINYYGNVFQSMHFAPQEISARTGINPFKVAPYMIEANKDALFYLKQSWHPNVSGLIGSKKNDQIREFFKKPDNKHFTADELSFLNAMSDAGVFGNAIADEAKGQYGNKILQYLADKGGFMFEQFDKQTRIATALGYYRLLKTKHGFESKTPQEILDEISNLVYKTNFYYGKANHPQFIQHHGGVNKFLRLANMFSNYQRSVVAFYVDAVKQFQSGEKTGKQMVDELAYGTVSAAVLGGWKSIPFILLGTSAANILSADDIDREIDEALLSTPVIGNFLYGGLPGALGIDPGKRLSAPYSVSSSFFNPLSPDTPLYRFAYDTGDSVHQILQGKIVDGGKSLVLPVAYQKRTSGVKAFVSDETKKKVYDPVSQQVFYVDQSFSDKLIMSFGLTPISQKKDMLLQSANRDRSYKEKGKEFKRHYESKGMKYEHKKK